MVSSLRGTERAGGGKHIDVLVATLESRAQPYQRTGAVRTVL